MTKGKKAGSFFLGFTGFFAAFLLELLIMLFMAEGTVFFAFFRKKLQGERFGSPVESFFSVFTGTTFAEIVQLVYAVLAVIIFSLWFTKVFHGEHGSFLKGRGFSLRLVFGILLLMIGMQFAVTIVYNTVAWLSPETAEHYERLVEIAGFDEPDLLLGIYGIFFGPVAEELIFRGVTLHYFKRAVPFWLANILQAVLFGAYHMNLMQGIYAFFVGLIFGYIFYRGGSLVYSILAHIFFNIMGFTGVLEFGAENPYYDFIWMPVMVLTLILGSMLYFGRLEEKKTENG